MLHNWYKFGVQGLAVLHVTSYTMLQCTLQSPNTAHVCEKEGRHGYKLILWRKLWVGSKTWWYASSK